MVGRHVYFDALVIHMHDGIHRFVYFLVMVANGVPLCLYHRHVFACKSRASQSILNFG